VYIHKSVYDWDRDKARRNLEKHGVSFFEAAGAFRDPLGLDGSDEAHSWLETRRLRLAKSRGGRMLVVSYTLRGTVVRIISARLANRKERARYAEA
jgi:uncharacterized DUF497 family protein